MAELELEPIWLNAYMCVLIQHSTYKEDTTVGSALIDCFSLMALELVGTFGSSVFSKVAEWFLASLISW